MVKKVQRLFLKLASNYGRAWRMMFKGQGSDSLACFWGFVLVSLMLAAFMELMAWAALFGGLLPQQYVQQLETSLHAAAFPVLWLTLYMQLFVSLGWLILLPPFPAAIVRRLRNVGVGTGRVIWLGGSMASSLILTVILLGMRAFTCPGTLLYGIGILWLLSHLLAALSGLATLVPLLAPARQEKAVQPPGIRRLLS